MASSSFHKLAVPAVACAALLVAGTATFAQAAGGPGAVYLMAAHSKGNLILSYERSADGKLAEKGVYPTHGMGAPLYGSHGAMVLSNTGRWLIAANTGSNNLSVFEVVPGGGLALRQVISSGSVAPVSVALRNDKLMYVLHYGSRDITGFTLSPGGRLNALANSTRTLAGAYRGAGHLRFTPNGKLLVVSDMVNRMIQTFTLDANGFAQAVTAQTTPNEGPAGMAFGPDRRIYVAETASGRPSGGTISTYRYEDDGKLQVTSPALGTNQTATSSILAPGSYAYALNNGSGTVSMFQVTGGDLSLVSTGEGAPCQGAEDMAFTRDNDYLFVLSPMGSGICTYKVEAGGHLSTQPTDVVVPTTAVQAILVQ